jgi:ribosomal protein S13
MRALRSGRDLTAKQIRALGNAYLDQNALADAKERLAVAQQGDDQIGAATVHRNFSRGNLRRAQRLFRAGVIDQTALTNARAAALEAQNSLDQEIANGAQDAKDQLSLMQSRAALRESTLPDSSESGARGAQTVADLNDQLAYAKQHGLDEETINGLQTSINETVRQNAQDAKARAEDARQKTRDSISALFDYRRSLTDNPVRLAKLDEQEAKALGGVGGDRNQRLQDRASINEKRRSREQAVRDRKIENLDYEHDIEKLSDDAYIRSLERILKTMKVGTEARRQLRMKIGRLKHDMDSGGDFELNVGNIKLPTAYEVRRAALGGSGGGGGAGARTVTNNISPTFNVTGANAEEIVNTLVKKLGVVVKTSTKAKSKAAGMK